MKTSTWKETVLSRMMLGTAQFGMPYGVANRTGQPAYGDVVAIVAAALEGGINCFDTAAVYGSSEAVLGQALSELKAADRTTVVTKIRPLTELSTAREISDAIRQSVEQSRRRLRIDCLPLVLFHREEDFGPGGPVLEDLRQRGWLKRYGVSCGNRPGPAAEFVASGQVSALQLPGNLLDRRHLSSGVLPQASARGVAVFVRSVYLQGLLVMNEAAIPPALADVVPVRRKLQAIAAAAGISIAELALRYLLSFADVTSVVVGVETVAQVRTNLAMAERGSLGAELLAAINAAVPDLPEPLITPSLWPVQTPAAENRPPPG